MPLTTMITPEDRARFADALERVFQGGERCTMRLAATKGLGRPRLTGEMLLLPLANDRGDSPLVLGCLVTSGSIGRAPRRMEIETIHHSALDITVPAADRPATAPAPVTDKLRSKGFAEPSTAYVPPTPPAHDAPVNGLPRGRLRLIKTDA